MKSLPPLHSALFATLLVSAPLACRADAPGPEKEAPAPAEQSAPVVQPAVQTGGAAGTVLLAKTDAPKAKPAPAAPAPVPSAPAPDAASGKTQVTLGDVTIEGTDFENDAATGLITVTGNPRVFRGDEELRATRIVINPKTRQFTAEGNVIIRRGVYEQRATRATYNFDQQEGQLENVTGLFRNIYLRADQLFIHPGPVYEARRARITTCDEEHPHYDLYSRSVDIYPQKKLITHQSGVDLLGMRLLTIPRVEKSLEPKPPEQQNPYPSLGYNRRDGPFIEKQLIITHKGPAWWDAHIRAYFERDPSGGVMFATPGRLQYVGTAFYRDLAEDQRVRHLEVSKLPEVGVIWSPQQDQPRPGKFLPHQVAGIRRTDELELSNKWRYAASLTGGYFKQYQGDSLSLPNSQSKDGERIAFNAQAILPLVHVGPIWLNDLRLMANQNVYNGGDQFGVLGVGIGKQVKVGRFRFRLDRFDQYPHGETPFQFDNIELRHEWRPGMEYRSGKFNFSYFIRLDGSNYSVFDQELAVSRLFHCIEPRLAFRGRNGEVMLEVRIPGFASGANRARVGEPVTQDDGGSVPTEPNPQP